MPNSAAWAQSGEYNRRRNSAFTKRFFGLFTGNSAGNFTVSIWTPATGKKVRLKGGFIQAHIQTTLASAAAGSAVALVDGTLAATTVVTVTPFVVSSATQAAGPWFGASSAAAGFTFDFHEGWTSATADNVLKIALIDCAAAPAEVTLATGKIAVSGVLFGDEV